MLLLTLFVWLGHWQWQRGEARESQWVQFEQSPVPALTRNPPDFDSLQRYWQVAFQGTYEPARQFLLDNRSHGGKPGYEVLTPLRLADGRRILVNRGWVPFTGYRDRLPDIAMSHGLTATVAGRLDELPVAGLASGRAAPDAGDHWPKVTAFPTHEELEAALGEKMSRHILLLDPRLSGGYVREWSPPGLAPARHFSYAIQWWGFALVLLVLYFGLNFRKVS